MACNSVVLSSHNCKQKKSVAVEFNSLIVAMYVR